MFTTAIFGLYVLFLFMALVSVIGDEVVKVYSAIKNIERQHELYLVAQDELEEDEE